MTKTSLRERNLVELLRVAGDPSAFNTLDGVRGDGGAPPIRSHSPACLLRKHGLRCSCWLRSLDELHRCLRVMRNDRRRLWFHLHERYVAAERRPLRVPVRHGRPVLGPNQQAVGLVNRADLNTHGNGVTRILVEQWNPRVNETLAAAGLVWLSDVFRGVPEVPVELMEHAA